MAVALVVLVIVQAFVCLPNVMRFWRELWRERSVVDPKEDPSSEGLPKTCIITAHLHLRQEAESL